MGSQLRLGWRIFGVLGAVLVLPVVALAALVALFHFNNVNEPPEPMPTPIPIPAPVGERMEILRDVEYGRVGGASLRLDVYRSTVPSAAPRPALLLIHGGGWVEGTKAGEILFANVLVPKGFVAFAVEYRLAKDDSSRYPAAVLDVRRAARWVRAHAAEYGADPKRLGAVGLSAGGHLAALLGTTDAPDPADPNSGRQSARVDCVVDTAGPADFTDDAAPPVGPKIAEVIPTFFGRDATPAIYRAASPALQVDAKAAPTLIVHGTADDLVPIEQSRRLDRALAAAKVDHKLVVLDGEPHVPTQQRWLDEMGDWLVGHLKP